MLKIGDLLNPSLPQKQQELQPRKRSLCSSFT